VLYSAAVATQITNTAWCEGSAAESTIRRWFTKKILK